MCLLGWFLGVVMSGNVGWGMGCLRLGVTNFIPYYYIWAAEKGVWGLAGRLGVSTRSGGGLCCGR